MTDTTAEHSTDVFDGVVELISGLVGDDLDILGVEVRPDTAFHEDLGLESIDLVTLGGLLADRYGPRVNLAEHLAEFDLDDVIGLTVGQIADYVAGALREGD
ncbi:phosphopantetheine-binding protein [Actinokineospora auranticolor]|uniref:Acyl carrier protein n=1 Tax=Actinokineospora auranticolor TaxID=155976 RepID=A0A2S6H159_9PSEU|nr:phosphopantetheine-binding protein [Actinokineospora auranticolor]PPK71215.1 acyl carrier protein [Actinokineospora auranticolor]